MLFKNATIYTMEEDPFIGDFRVDKGVFTEIGKNGKTDKRLSYDCLTIWKNIRARRRLE